MAAGIEIYNYVTNQKGSPALYSDVFANRPAAGFIGRLFVSTDTLEIYRDNGVTWDLIGGGGGPAVNIYNSDGTLTGTRVMTMAGYNLTFEGGASTARLAMSANNNVPRIFSFRTAGSPRWAFRVDDNETGSNAGANWYLRAYNDAGVYTITPFSVERATGEKSMIAIETMDAGTDTLTGVYNITGGTYLNGLTMTGGNPHGASHNNYTLANAGALTFANSIYLGAQSNVLRLQGDASGTITLQAASPGIRTAAATLNQIQYNTSTGNAITYTHASVMQTLGIYRLAAAGSLTVTNAYGLIVNDLNEYGYAATGGGALVLTNRWGIYQDSTTDVNYFGGTTLIGTTTNAGPKLQINGNALIQSDLLLRNIYNPFAAANRGNITLNGTASNILAFTNGTTGTGYLFHTGGSMELVQALNAYLAFHTNAIERGRITAGGNWIFGSTTDAGDRLQIVSSNQAALSLQSGTTAVNIQFKNTANTQGYFQYSNTDFNFWSAGVSAMALRGGSYAFSLLSGTAPTSSETDRFLLYSQDITAGNAAPHFRTENGNVIKIYQQTTAVAAATFTANSGTSVNDASTFDGYTINQVVKALRNLGLLA